MHCRFGPVTKKFGGGAVLSLSYHLPRLLCVRWEDTLLKTRNSHSHTLIYIIIRFVSSGMSKTTLLAAFFAVASSVRAQGTQWCVTARREKTCDPMLITFRL